MSNDTYDSSVEKYFSNILEDYFLSDNQFSEFIEELKKIKTEKIITVLKQVDSFIRYDNLIEKICTECQLNTENNDYKIIIQLILNKSFNNCNSTENCISIKEGRVRVKNITENEEKVNVRIEKIISTMNQKLKKLKENPQEILLDTIVNKITHSSANQTTKIIIGKNIAVVSNGVIPKKIYDKVLTDLKCITAKAFTNYYTYLSNNTAIFYDSNGHKYKFPINSIHFLGLLDNPDSLLRRDSIKKSLDSHSLEETQAQLNKPNLPLPSIQKVKHRRLMRLNDKVQNIPGNINDIGLNELAEIMKKIKEAQTELSQIMNDDRTSFQIEVLTWLMIKGNEAQGNERDIIQVYENDIISVIKNNAYRFSYKFKSLFDNNRQTETEEERKKIIKIVQCKVYNGFIRSSIKEKFTYIEQVQEYLMNLSIQCSLKLYNLIYGKDANKNNVDYKKYIDYFGLSKILIEDLINNNELHQELKSYNTWINFFKVFDKLKKLCNFNYVLDVNKIYITDSRNDKRSNICEMEALGELLLSYFEVGQNQQNLDFIGKFFSIQESKEKYAISSKKNNYEIILGLCENIPQKSNVLAKTHIEVKEKYDMDSQNTDNYLISALYNNKVILRFASSISVKNKANQDSNLQGFLNILKELYGNSKETSNDIKAIDEESIESILEWINYSNKEDIEKFVGADNLNEKQLTQIKLAFSIQMYEQLKKINPSSETYLDNIINSNKEIFDKLSSENNNLNDVLFEFYEQSELNIVELLPSWLITKILSVISIKMQNQQIPDNSVKKEKNQENERVKSIDELKKIIIDDRLSEVIKTIDSYVYCNPSYHVPYSERCSPSTIYYHDELSEIDKIILNNIIKMYINDIKDEVENNILENNKEKDALLNEAYEKIINYLNELERLHPYIKEKFGVNSDELEQSRLKR